MPDFDALPFPIGTTAGCSSATDHAELEGREFTIPDLDYSSSTGNWRSGYTGPDSRIVKIVRNKSGVALLPCLAVQYRSGYNGRHVIGYTTTNPSKPAGFVDEYLNATNGAPADDLFYIAVSGLVSYKVSATASEAVLVAGEHLTTVTAAASTTSTTAGRLTAAVTTGATGPLAAQLLNVIGINVSAATTADTNTNKLMRITNRL